METPFFGTILWGNGTPAAGVEVRAIDLDRDGSDDDMTRRAGTTNESGAFDGRYDPAWGIDRHTEQVTTWEPADPAHGNFTPVRVTHTVDVVDPLDVPDYRLECRFDVGDEHLRQRIPFLPTAQSLSRVGRAGRREVFAITRRGPLAVAMRPLAASSSVMVARETMPGVWSDWIDLGDRLRGGGPLRFGVEADGRLVVVGIDGDRALSVRREQSPGGSWEAWTSLGGTVASGGSFAVASNQDGRLEVFVRGTDGALWHRWQQAPGGGWGGWESLGGQLVDRAAIEVALDGQQRLHLFTHAVSGRIAHIHQQAPNSGWGGWSELVDTRVAGPLAVARNHDGRLEVFAQGTDGAIWHVWQTSSAGSWSSWSSLGGMWVADDLDAIDNADGRLEVFVTRSDGTYAHRWQTSAGGSWANWSSLGVVLGRFEPLGLRHPFAAGRAGDGRLVIVQQQPLGERAAYARAQHQAGSDWGEWTPIGPAAAPAVVRPARPTLRRGGSGDHWLEVEWDDVDGAVDYRLLLGTESHITATSYDVGAVTSFRVSNLSNGTVYVLRLVARNDAGEGPASPEITHACSGVPDGIADLGATTLTLVPPHPGPADNFNVNLRLRNTGVVPTGPFTVRMQRIRADSDVLPPPPAFADVQGGLAANEETTVQFHVAPLRHPGAFIWDFLVGSHRIANFGVIV